MRVTERICEISSLQALSENWQLLEAWEATWYIGQRARASPGEPAGSGVSEFIVQITDYYSELNHAARSSRLELELFSDLNILCGRVKIRNIQKLHPHSGKTRARYKWTHISEYCVCRVKTLDCWADWTWRDPLSQPYHILLQAENLMRKIMMIIANYFVTIGFMG